VWRVGKTVTAEGRNQLHGVTGGIMRAAKDGRDAGRFCKSSPLVAMARHPSGATERWHSPSKQSFQSPPPRGIGQAWSTPSPFHSPLDLRSFTSHKNFQETL
jgi:hypothetical protein